VVRDGKVLARFLGISGPVLGEADALTSFLDSTWYANDPAGSPWSLRELFKWIWGRVYTWAQSRSRRRA